MEQKVQIKTNQTTTMATQLQQNLKILQASGLELLEAVRSELLENPVLEEESVVEIESVPRVSLSQEEVDWERFFEHPKLTYASTNSLSGEISGLENLPEKQPSLHKFLEQQLRLTRMTEKERTIAQILITGIDERGYLTTPLETICEAGGANLSEVEMVLSKVQEFEPPGVGAREIKECLLLQIKDLGLKEPLLEDLIKDYLPQIQRKEYGFLSRRLKVSMEEIKRLIGLLLKLEPIPVRLYERLEVQQVIPDIIITHEPELKIELNNQWMPQVRINSYYQSLLKQDGLMRAEKEFIKERLKNGLAFIKSLEERKTTLLRVCEVIFKWQKQFLTEGITGLVPMRLEDVAKELNYHETTISRAIAYKYVKTCWGIFPLKFFFSSGLTTQGGEEISSSAVKQRIKELIKGEDSQRPLRDEQIVQLLKDEGVSISRRTVSSYRESLGLLPSFLRRQR